MNKQARNKILMKFAMVVFGGMFIGSTVYGTAALYNTGPQGIQRQVETLVYQAQEDLKQQHFDRAREKIDQAIKLAPKHPEPHTLLANIYFKDKLWEKAQNEYEKAVAADETNIKTLQNLAICYSFLNKLDLAETTYIKALKRDPSNVLVRTNLGVIYLNQKKYDQARTHLQKALRINNSFPDLHRNLGVLYKETGEKELAIKHFQTYLERSPNATDKPAIAQLIESLKAENNN